MNPLVVIVMGVSGSGKSTVGALLAARLSLPFVEADDFHDPSAIRQMASGRPLTAEQRHDWLTRVHGELVRLAPDGVVCACSALTRSAREQLVAGLPEAEFVWLHGPPDVLRRRLMGRVGHPVGTSLLPSQLQTLEPPTDALSLDVRREPEVLADEIANWLHRRADAHPGAREGDETPQHGA